MGNKQSSKKFYKPPLRENLLGTRLTLKNAYKNDIKFDPDNETQYSAFFNKTQDNLGELSSGDCGGISKDSSEGNIRCCPTGWAYGRRKFEESCGGSLGTKKCARYSPYCTPNNDYYDTKKKQNLRNCCLGGSSIKDKDGNIKFEECAYIAKEDVKAGCSGAGGKYCHPPTKAEIWAPWSKTCALDTDTIQEYCKELIVVSSTIRDKKYGEIYMLVPRTEDAKSNCKHWKEYKDNKDILASNIRNDYDTIIKNFCKITGTIDDNNNNLNGFSYPCICYNYQENPVYKAIVKATKAYCEKSDDPKCDSENLAGPQCWLPDCREGGDYILKTEGTSYNDNCPQVQCSVFLNIADNKIGGDLTVGDVTVNACSPSDSPPLDKEKTVIIVVSTVVVLVFLTFILFIFKFLRKK